MKLFEQPLDKICNKSIAPNPPKSKYLKMMLDKSDSSNNAHLAAANRCQQTLSSSRPQLPPPIKKLLGELYARGPSTIGIFRKSPNAKQCKELRQKLEASSAAQIDDFPVTVVASVFKEWLRSLPDCLLMSRLYEQWIEAAKLIEPLQGIVVLHASVDSGGGVAAPTINSVSKLRNVSLAEQSGNIFKFRSKLRNKQQPQTLDRARSCSTAQLETATNNVENQSALHSNATTLGSARSTINLNNQQQHMSAAKRKAECRKMVRKLIESLDEPNIVLLRALICVLWHIAENSDYNKMSAQNLGVCVGQSLLNDDKKAAAVKRHRRSRSQCLLSLTLSWSTSSSPSSSSSSSSSPSSSSSALLSNSFGQLGAAQEIAKYVPMLVAFMIENAHELFGADVTNLFSTCTEQQNGSLQPSPTSSDNNNTAAATFENVANDVNGGCITTNSPLAMRIATDCNENSISLSPVVASKESLAMQSFNQTQNHQMNSKAPVTSRPLANEPLRLHQHYQQRQRPQSGHCPPLVDGAASMLAAVDQLDGLPIPGEDLRHQLTPKLAADVANATELSLEACESPFNPNARHTLCAIPTNERQQQQQQRFGSSNDDDDYKTTIMIVNKGNSQQTMLVDDASSQRAPSSVLGAHSPTLSNYTQSHNSSQAEISVGTSSGSSPSAESSSSFSSLSQSSASSPTPPMSHDLARGCNMGADGTSMRSESLACHSLQSNNQLSATPTSLPSMSPASPTSTSSSSLSDSETEMTPKADIDDKESSLEEASTATNKAKQSSDANEALVRNKFESLKLEVKTATPTGSALPFPQQLSNDDIYHKATTMNVANCDARQFQRSPITRQEMLKRRHMMNRYSTILGIPNRAPKIPVCLTTSSYGGEAVIYNPAQQYQLNMLNNDADCNSAVLNSIDAHQYQNKVITVEPFPVPPCQDNTISAATVEQKQQQCYVTTAQQQLNNNHCSQLDDLQASTALGRNHYLITGGRQVSSDFCQQPQLVVNTKHSLASAPSLPLLPSTGYCYDQRQQFQQNSQQQFAYQNLQQFQTSHQQQQQQEQRQMSFRYTSASNTNLNYSLQAHTSEPFHHHNHHHHHHQLQAQRSHVMLLRDHYLALQNQQRQRQEQQLRHRPISASYSQTHHRPPVLYTLL